MVDATAAIVAPAAVDAAAAQRDARASGVPQSAPGRTYVQLEPQRIQVWRGPAEFSRRTVMRAGAWLDDPLD